MQNKNQYFKNIIHTKSVQALFGTRPGIGQSFPEHCKTKPNNKKNYTQPPPTSNLIQHHKPAFHSSSAPPPTKMRS